MHNAEVSPVSQQLGIWLNWYENKRCWPNFIAVQYDTENLKNDSIKTEEEISAYNIVFVSQLVR